jgi:hypothetical protein
MGRMMGIEPTNLGATIRCVNHFATSAIILAGVVGIEPTPEVLETSVLPLNYTPVLRWWRGTDSNRRTLRERIYSPPRLATSLPLRTYFNLFILSEHRTKVIKQFAWCRREDLNPQPTDYDSVALPIELHRHNIICELVPLPLLHYRHPDLG